MKNVKWFSLFFVCMLFSLLGGILLGVKLDDYFYPGTENNNMKLEAVGETASSETIHLPVKEVDISEVSAAQQMLEASGQEEVVNADTVYILIERDMDTGEEIETATKLPGKYLGMNREQFVTSMEDYEANPPLTELERGFVDLEVVRFSPSQVDVVMNYSYVKPSNSFFVVVYDSKVTVLLEDKKTVFLNTDIDLSELPGSLQQDIIQGMYMPDEESLYDFLEGYTS